MPLSDAERDELKTLIREMAKESAEIWCNSPVPGLQCLGDLTKTTRPNNGLITEVLTLCSASL